MGAMIAIPRHRAAGNERGREHPPFVGPLLLTLGILGFAIAASALGLVRAARLGEAAIAESLAESPTRELGREWSWEEKAVEFENVYRQKAAPRLDWIRLSR